MALNHLHKKRAMVVRVGEDNLDGLETDVLGKMVLEKENKFIIEKGNNTYDKG